MPIGKFLAASLVGAGFALASAAQAAVLLQDDFGTPAGSTLNVASLANWTISNGTVDLIRSGDYGIACVGGSGGCLDMDGSTGDAGRITSTSTFLIMAGVDYSFTALVSGNQRGGAADSITFGFIDAVTNSVIATGSPGAIAAGDGYSTMGFTSFIYPTDLTVRLFIEASGGDNIGPILDSVVFSDDGGAPVSEPGTALLTGLGLFGVAALRRRRART